MKTPTLVISNPPHDEVDVEAAADLMDLDVFATRLKASFAAPEIFAASGPDKAVELAIAIRKTGFKVTILQGAALAGLPWPDPVTHLAFDESSLRATVRGKGIEIAYDTEVVGVFCQPPPDFSMERTVDIGQAIASGHGPTIAEAIQWRSNIDLYFLSAGSRRRVSILPHMFEMDGDDVVRELDRRFEALRLDRRLSGVRPRTRFVRREQDEEGEPHLGASRRRRYSFGTQLLSELLGSISPELRDVPQYELGSRIAYALNPVVVQG
jgi:hypothetical protein